MRIIFQIAGAELRTLFYSPIAWIIAIVFFLACGIQFTQPLETLAAQQQFYQDNTKDWQGYSFSLTHTLFTSASAYLLNNLFLFIPLLTMGAISREVHSGTMHLLSSSPVSTRDIVLGKYLGLAIYNLVLMVPLFLLFVAGSFFIVFPEVMVFVTTLLGIYLLTCTYTAIGLFVSALTNYQVVAALATFMLFLLMTLMPMLGQQYDTVRDITYFLNLSGRVESFLTGLITTKDLLYFLLIILLFLAFTHLKLKSKKVRKPWYMYLMKGLSIFVVIILLGYITHRPAQVGYLDVTRDKINTIHPNVQNALKELKGEPLKVTLYTNLMDNSYGSGVPAARNTYVWGVWGKYLRFHPNIDFKYVYYYDLRDGDSSFYKQYPKKTLKEIAHRTMRLNALPKSIFKSPEEIRQLIDLSEEGKRLVMQLEYKGRKTFLRTFDDMLLWPDQSHFAAAFRRLVRDASPTILFTAGHYERSPYKLGEREYAAHTQFKFSRAALVNLGVDVDTIDLSNNGIPDSTSLLVVADPNASLNPDEQQKINSYVNKGGNALFYGEPGKQALLNPLLKPIGVALEEGIIVSPNKHEMAHMVVDSLTDASGRLAGEQIMYLYQVGKKPLPPYGFSGSAHVNYTPQDSLVVKRLFDVANAENAWIERGQYIADSAAPVYSVEEGDMKKDRLTQGITIQRKMNNKEQRIIITGDADFMSRYRGSGGTLGNGLYSWLLNNAYPIYTNYPPAIDNRLSINRVQSKATAVIFIYIIPGVVLVFATIFLIRRTRK